MARLTFAVAAAAAILALSGASAQAPAPGPTQAPAAKPKPAKPPAPRKQQTAAPAPAPNSGKSLCVASAIGHKFDIKVIGLTIFGNEFEQASIAAWGIDDTVVRMMTNIVRRKYAVRRIDIPKSAIAAYEGRHDLFKNPRDDLVAGLRTAAGNKCDLVLVAIRSASNYSGTNQTLAGLGVLSHGRPINERIYAFAIFDLVLYDGRDFRQIKNAWPTTDPLLLGSLMGSGIRGMYRRIDNALWPTSAQAAAQSEQLKSAIRALVEEGLGKSVAGMFAEGVE